MIKKILVPLAFSKYSRGILDLAADLAKRVPGRNSAGAAHRFCPPGQQTQDLWRQHRDRPGNQLLRDDSSKRVGDSGRGR